MKGYMNLTTICSTRGKQCSPSYFPPHWTYLINKNTAKAMRPSLRICHPMRLWDYVLLKRIDAKEL